MRKIMDLEDNTTMDDLVRLSEMFRHPIAVKMRKNLELWIED
ncbi:MAG: hypothetical protein Q8M94_15655 [Ignavibacteria bacterium]|nr:hypothetical protein [Ignavibacteria bacterium]